jgi:hypothetical protein
MSDVPPPKNAFEQMMAAARTTATATPAAVADKEGEEAEPVLTAVLYEAHLEHADESEPLWRVPYFGQVVRVGTAEDVFAKRKREHEIAAAREDKDLGLHAVIGRFGPDAMAWRIVSSETGPRTAMRELANAEEIRLIDEHGGVLQDMDAKRKQTLNLTKGGHGDARMLWANMDARRRRAYTKFQAAMKKYVEAHDSALVPNAYVDDDGHRLGTQLFNFRRGGMRKGAPWESEAKAWAEALPKWQWNARNDDLFHSRRGQQKRWNGYARFKAQMMKHITKSKSAYVARDFVDVKGYPLGQQLHDFRLGHTWKGTPWEDEARGWAEALPRWTWNAKQSDEYAALRRKLAIEQHVTERRAELERARMVVVPFEKSKRRRIELHVASTDFSGRMGNAVLYMISEDGKTIRRVQKNGSMGEEYIVGPVVDAAVPEAAPLDLNASFVSSGSDSG